MTKEIIITPYDINAGEVEPVWRYKLQTKVSPAADGTPYELIAEGDVNPKRVAVVKAEIQSDLDYWNDVDTELTAKIAETENAK